MQILWERISPKQYYAIIVNKSHLNVTVEKKFFKKKYLSRHENTYTREKPYKCQFCEKRFSKKDYFICHKCILCLLVDLIQIPSQETIF